MLFTLDANLSWLQDARIALGDMIDFLTQTPRLRNRAAAIADLRRASADQPETRVPAEFLVNICVDHDSAAGPAGPALAAWLTEKGIDASRHSVNALEDWIVVFNPSVVSRVQRVPAAEVDLSMRVLPKIADQLAMTQESESCEEIEDEVLGLSCSG